MTNKEKEILQQLRKDVRSKSQKCYNTSCKNLAIRSHIQQVEGAIRKIASVDRKIVQVEDSDYFTSSSWYFKEKGIKQKGDVLTFWGFCNKCDTELFKEIECNSIDYSNYRNQVLFSYRGFLSEHYKQEYNLKWYVKILQSSELTEECKKRFNNKYIQYQLIVKSGKFTKSLLESDLKRESKNFQFINFQLPRIDICTSTVYSLPTAIILNDTLLQNLEIRKTFPPISSSIFINLIPTNDALEVILGCHADKNIGGKLDLDKVKNYNQKAKIKMISDILIRHIETWFVSKSLYNIWKSRKMDHEIIKQMEKYKPAHMKSKHVKFNIFHDIIN
ncbi:hypothetical protein SY27_00905 [Flavobacterium sp. 316]|uniref:hypothetical protein n=1 Tax=Flavobacterium sp. 316 TaxID=1603293 RepID=UPI0005E9B75C|nr:hypothetical protein [Flavobacterium sp. 316]KIX22442.1 hypothetical protein SY27_00905 [Flavobacterium sp. 316]